MDYEEKKIGMIRVLHVVGSLAAGGMESYIMNLYRHIDREKVQFDFVVGDETNYYESEILSMGGEIYRYKTGIKGFYKYYLLLKNHPKYRLVHSHRDAMSTIYLFIAMIAGVKVRISHSHNTNRTGLAAVVAVILKPFLRFVATQRWACGQGAGEWLFGKQTKFEVKANAVDCEKFSYCEQTRQKVRQKLGISDDELFVGHVGRFEEQKNHLFLLSVFAELSRMHKARLLCIGDGSLKLSIEERSKDLQIKTKCIFAGNRNDVNELLQAIDIIVFPSFYEGFSFAMVEFQAAALPVLASNTIPQEVNLTGLIRFKSLADSPVSWANEVLLMNNHLNRVASNASKCIAEKGYDIQKNVRQLQADYLRLVGEIG